MWSGFRWSTCSTTERSWVDSERHCEPGCRRHRSPFRPQRTSSARGRGGQPGTWGTPQDGETPGDDGYAGSGAPPAVRDPSSEPEPGWNAVYYDSPRSLTPKLLLADERGLAGAGFWAI